MGHEARDLFQGSDASALPSCSMNGSEELKEGKMGREKLAVISGKLAVAWIALSVLLVPVDLAAKEKHGAWLKIEKLDGFLVEGELLKVSGETLVLFDKGSQQGRQVELGDVWRLKIRRKTNVVIWILAGVTACFPFIEGVRSIVLYNLNSQEDRGSALTSLMIAVPVGIGLASIATRGFRGHYQKRKVTGMPEIERAALLDELRSLSREMRAENPE